MGHEQAFTAADPPVPTDPPEAGPLLMAALNRFAREGFGAPLRVIAADADVSAALIIKRYGTKEGLRAACDGVALEWIRAAKTRNIGVVAGGGLLPTLVGGDEYAPLVGYVMQSVIAGGSLGRSFVEHMIADAEGYLADAVAAGVIRPSRDERARARYLVTSSLGSFLLTMLLEPDTGGRSATDLPGLYRMLASEGTGPMLELYTEGLFTTRRILEDFLLHPGDAPGPADSADRVDTATAPHTDEGKDGEHTP
ncbi:TetR/AcrR family transcriptional regulator [Pseudactinotalea sp. HY158]|uniref:TetR/AcrR family transcriptional regulator n=1 Tax=Pseudactinotalea sp. HY158 TaxID=2654547 RepID=UPI001E63DC97|nr:TetR family transcriptional regulator [Pseudactinotalea sp. HY158]